MEKLPERIVYIDDDQEMREMVRDLVEAREFPGAFAICGSGDEFFKRIRVLQPQLVLLDLRMHGESGVDILEMMQRMPEAEGLPVIFLTGVADLEMIKHYAKLGVIGVIKKPLNIDTFLEDVEAVWLKHAPDEHSDEGNEPE